MEAARECLAHQRRRRGGGSVGGVKERGTTRYSYSVVRSSRSRRRRSERSVELCAQRKRWDDVAEEELEHMMDMSDGLRALSVEELLVVAQQSHGSRGKTARRRLNEHGIQVEKPKARQRDRVSKQKKDRQGWNKAQMRRAQTRMCVSCKRLAPKAEFFRIVKTGSGLTDMEFVLASAQTERERGVDAVNRDVTLRAPDELRDEEQEEEDKKEEEDEDVRVWGRSAYVCRDAACVKDAGKKMRVVRALQLTPREQATRKRSEEIMNTILPFAPIKPHKHFGPPDDLKHLRVSKPVAYADANVDQYKLAHSLIDALSDTVRAEMHSEEGSRARDEEGEEGERGEDEGRRTAGEYAPRMETGRRRPTSSAVRETKPKAKHTVTAKG